MTNLATKTGTNHGPELLIRLRGGRRRAQLEDRLRELVRDGTLPAGQPPALLACARRRSRGLAPAGRRRLRAAARGGLSRSPPRRRHLRGGCGRRRRRRSPATAGARCALRLLPRRSRPGLLPAGAVAARPARSAALGARQPRSPIRTRAERPSCAARSPPTCGACAASSPTPIRSSSARAPRRVSRCSAGRSRTGAVMRSRWRIRACRRIARCSPMPVCGSRGRRSTRRASTSTRWRRPRSSTTPAHQCPTGVVLSPRRRAALIEWARAGGLVIEDDYDAEFRYDRAPLGALQGLAPDRVVYLGTVSKTLAPGLRLGWLVLPAVAGRCRRRGEAARRSRLADDRAARARAADRDSGLRPPSAQGAPAQPRTAATR